jgi:acid phosphatase
MPFLFSSLKAYSAFKHPARSLASQRRGRHRRAPVQPSVEELEARQVLSVPTPDHVVIVIEENHGYSQIIGSANAPYINYLASFGALFTQSFALSHPSQPNYLQLFSGSNQGVTSDSCPHTFNGANLGAALETVGWTFGGFSETMPSVGFTGCSFGGSGGYQRKHNPWVNFTNVSAADNMPFTFFPFDDFTQLPTVSFVVPNQNNDMHDGSVQQGDDWLGNNIDPYVNWAYDNNSLLILTFDEDNGLQGNRIPTLFLGPMVNPGAYPERINHYNVLRTIEDMYGLPYAGQSADAFPIEDIWVDPGASPRSSSTQQSVHTIALLLAEQPETRILDQQSPPALAVLAPLRPPKSSAIDGVFLQALKSTKQNKDLETVGQTTKGAAIQHQVWATLQLVEASVQDQVAPSF